jgi:hypothetical protein
MKLFRRHKTPWKLIIEDGNLDTDLYDGPFRIVNADGEVVINVDVNAGDNEDEININQEEAKELVEIINRFNVGA